jgi:hypothetical protein
MESSVKKNGNIPSDTWRKGFDKIVILRLCGTRSNRSGYIRGAVLAAVPFIFALCFDASFRNNWKLISVIFIMSLLTWITMLASIQTWHYVYRRKNILNAALTSNEDKVLFEKYANIFFSQSRQIIFSVIFATVILLYLIAISSNLRQVVPVSISSYISAFWTVFVGSNSLYWLWCGISLLAKTLRDSKSLSLWWWDPSRTPITLMMYKVAFLVLSLLSLGLFLVAAMILLQRDYWLSTSLMPFVVALGAGATLFLCRIAYFLWFDIGDLVYKRISEMRFYLARRLDKSKIDKVTPHDVNLLQMYKDYLQLSRFPINTAAQIAYGSVVFGAVFTFALSLIINIK